MFPFKTLGMMPDSSLETYVEGFNIEVVMEVAKCPILISVIDEEFARANKASWLLPFRHDAAVYGNDTFTAVVFTTWNQITI